MIENPETAGLTFLGDADGVVVGVDPLTVRVAQASGPGVIPIAPGDVRPQVFEVGLRPRLGDKVRLIRNIWAPDRWAVSVVLQTAPKPAPPRRCGSCNQPMVDGHDEIVCSLTPVEAMGTLVQPRGEAPR